MRSITSLRLAATSLLSHEFKSILKNEKYLLYLPFTKKQVLDRNSSACFFCQTEFEAEAVLNDSPVDCQIRAGDRARRRDTNPVG